MVVHKQLTGLQKLIVIQFEKGTPQTEVWRALYGAASARRADGKWVVAVDMDIDAENGDAIFWAMCYRCKPHRDMQTLLHKDEGHTPRSKYESEDSSVLINAVLKETFPPIAMPKREYMENARRIWEELGFQKLRPVMPWYGYDLGAWNDHLERQAQLAVAGDYWETGRWCARNRRSDVEMNTELRAVNNSSGRGPTAERAARNRPCKRTCYDL